MDDNYITTDTCDCCRLPARTPVVMMHHNGTPVLAACRECQSAEFERVAGRDIDSWLEGSDVG